VDTLRSCFAILFPTYFACECFAGTALDAFSARIPIIANDWLYNSEVIEDHRNGFIYPFRDNDRAAEILYELYTDKNLYKNIQNGCEESMSRFSTDVVMGRFNALLK
jgi:glycosyltransferase involved in cell wall biosynthesis